jgi:hypothetical protein
VRLAEDVVTWGLSLALVWRKGALAAELVVLWTESLFVVETDVLVAVLVVMLVIIVVDATGLSVVVTTTTVEEVEKVCVRAVTTVTADGTPRQCKISTNQKYRGRWGSLTSYTSAHISVNATAASPW